MKKYFVSAALLLLVGAGCAATDDTGMITDTQLEAMNDEVSGDEAGGRVADPVAFPSGTFEMYRGQGYALPVDQDFKPVQDGDNLRLQNYDIQNGNLNTNYGDNAFSIQIMHTDDDQSTQFRADYEHGGFTELAGETVLTGEGPTAENDNWPGFGYYNTDRKVLIRVNYTGPDGKDIAEAVLSHLTWE